MKIQCDLCNKAEASVFCSADEAALCGGCDRRIHTANKLSTRHIRFSLHHPSSSTQSPNCDICQEKRAFLFCQEERAILCRECVIQIHRANQHGHKHSRFLLTGVKISPAAAPSSSSSSSSVSEPKTLHPASSTPCRSDEDQHCMFNHINSVSTDNISDYLMETLPGWPVDELLDPSSYPNGVYEIRDHDFASDVFFPPRSNDSSIWVPRASSNTSYSYSF